MPSRLIKKNEPLNINKHQQMYLPSSHVKFIIEPILSKTYYRFAKSCKTWDLLSIWRSLVGRCRDFTSSHASFLARSSATSAWMRLETWGGRGCVGGTLLVIRRFTLCSNLCSLCKHANMESETFYEMTWIYGLKRLFQLSTLIIQRLFLNQSTQSNQLNCIK